MANILRYLQGLPETPPRAAQSPQVIPPTPSLSPDLSRALFSPPTRMISAEGLPVSSITSQPSPVTFFTPGMAPQTRKRQRKSETPVSQPTVGQSQRDLMWQENMIRGIITPSLSTMGRELNEMDKELFKMNSNLKNIRPPAQTGGRNPPQYAVTYAPREIQPSVNIAAEPPIHVSRREIKSIDTTASSNFGYVPRKEDYLDSCMKANTFIDLDNRYLLYKQNNMESTPSLPTMRMYASGFDVVPNITPQLGNGYLQGGYQDIRNNVLDRTNPPYRYYDRTFSGIGSER